MKEKNKQVSAAELARVADYSPAAITVWTNTGILKRTRGKYDLRLSLEAIKRHEILRGSDGGHDRGELAVLKKTLLEKKIAKLDHELGVLTGKVHDRIECCQSLTALRAVESRELQQLGRIVAAAHPEHGNKLKSFIDAQVDSILEKLHSGQAYTAVKFSCPHCHQRVEKLDAEPVTPSKETA